MTRKYPKENYITRTTLPRKANEWLNTIKPFISSHRQKEFQFDSRRSALLIIDMQRFFLEPKSHACIPAAFAIVKNIQRILAEYRKWKHPIFYTYYAHLPHENPGIMGRWWNDPLRDDDPLACIVSQLEPLETETVLRKPKYSAFAGTNLDLRLRQLSVDQILITGVMTHLCCETTARAAFQHNYEVYFCIDGTATQYEELHVGSLKALADGFAIPILTRDVLNCLKKK